MTSTASTPSPPEWMQPGEPSMADNAVKRINELQKKRSSIFTFPCQKKNKGEDKGASKKTSLSPDLDPVNIDFKDQRKSQTQESRADLFKWAIIYENQRGLTIFSTPYYSSRSLLPTDPPPFNVPDPGEGTPTHPHHEAPPNVSLRTYPLPDPTWRWVHASWLVDMRGDGDVQHDGFEYNWFFRRRDWRTQVGWFSAGGWVRRRRWVRLMMRPSDDRLQAEAAIEERAREDVTDVTQYVPDSGSQGVRVWRGDHGDWGRIRKALKTLGRDGPKLECWADWLAHLTHERDGSEGLAEESQGAISKPQLECPVGIDSKTSEREHPLREWIVAVLHEHRNDILGLFIYPDSRAQLRNLLMQAGFVEETVINPTGSSEVACAQFPGFSDFWSSTSGHDFQSIKAGSKEVQEKL